MNLIQKSQLLELARETIESHFSGQKFDLNPISKEFLEKRGVFVTLTKNGELRGCIGYILPIKSIYESVKENALHAAFNDSRFLPIKKEELKNIKIEISILSLPKLIAFSRPEELLKKLKPGIDGLILEKNGRQSTFLPQVWEELPDKVEFLEHLSLKAGFGRNIWKEARISTYQAEVFGEESEEEQVLKRRLAEIKSNPACGKNETYLKKYLKQRFFN